jgi:DNA polymerase-3 subunit alpha
MPSFVHLHNHTEFSLLDGAAKIEDMTSKACDCGMSHVAITDHGNMFGVPKFVLAARKKGLKPIVGCEFYIIDGNAHERIKGQKRYHQIMWAKNAEGYRNLVKLCSYGYTDGYYYKPRIDKNILRQHTEGVIASTCCLASQVNQTLLQKGEDEAEKMLMEYIDMFGKENYYVEIQRHTLGDMEKCNHWLLSMSKKHDLKVIATNDVHYVNREDADAHDLLLALQTQSDYNDTNRFRFTDDKGRLNPRFYFKNTDEMLELFQDVPHALDQTVELAERCEFEMNLTGEMILPQYDVPKQYKDMDDYLRAMVWERVPSRYPEVSTEIRERIDHELKIIKRMGYAGYFLIVQSFTTEARRRGVYVGPGRGSAAGSVVAYVLGIIDIDPLTYDLLFERFLNPERVSPPDIDIDFDDEGRQEVIDYVVNEYGRKSVSQVITYGTMGAKTALRDVGRSLGIPLSEVNRIAKLIPDKPGMSFKKAIDPEKNPDGAEELYQLFESTDPNIKKMMTFAKTLEGTARHTGVHACAVIIAPNEVTDFVPVSKAKDDAIVTQYDGPMAEMCGLLKMDFLGLKTLSIIKTAIRLVKEAHGIEMHPDDIELTDEKTYELYQRGDTVATFQFESDGMRKYLRQLKPTNIEDLIAMNALYRPGPMDNIPSFVNRKHGREPIQYPHEMLEPILKNTYGIMVYQEQIMQVAQKMGQYSLGGADLLRRAMGKKKMDIMKKEKVNFIKGAEEQGVAREVAEDVFGLMEKFASYGFNKCLVGDTEIVDAESGAVVTIEEIFKGKGSVSVTPSLNTDNLKLQPQAIVDVMDNGIKDVFELTTTAGRKIRATANHPFYVFEGWKNLEELAPGDLIATPRKLEVEGKNEWPEHEVIVLGHLLAEGNLCHPHSVYYYSQDDDQLADYVKAAEEFQNVQCTVSVHKETYSVYAKRKKRNEPSGIVEWAKRLEIWGKNARQKEIPSEVFCLTNDQICLLISRMWEGDGHINEAGRSLFYATSSEKLAYQIQHLLLRLGIVGRIRKVNFPYKEGRIGYQVFVTSRVEIEIFHHRIGCHFVSKSKKEALKRIITTQLEGRSSKDIIPTAIKELVRDAKAKSLATWKEINAVSGVHPRNFYPKDAYQGKSGFRRNTISQLADFFQEEKLAKYAHSDIYWDKIKSITYIGKQQTYDLEIEETHNFVANDIIVHNSHAAAYSVLAFKTAYMKAHYPAEYMASVLTHNVNDIKKITFFIEECRRMGIKVLPPDINESRKLFFVNPDGQIRFGLSAIKGVGSAVVEEIIKDREENGPFESVFDLTSRIDPHALNRKTMESLAYAGALDEFGIKRYQYFLNANGTEDVSVLDRAIQYGRKVQAEKKSAQISLFGGADSSGGLEEPAIPVGTMKDGKVVEAWTRLQELNFEKEVIGFYLSGHPLERYKWQIETFCVPIAELEKHRDQTVTIAGIVTNARDRISQRGNKFMTFNVEDFSGGADLALFGDSYVEMRNAILPDEMLLITGTYQPRWKDPSEYELRIREVKLMDEEVFEKMIKYVKIQVDNHLFNEDTLEELDQLIARFPGKFNLFFRIKDPELGAVEVVASEAQVEPNAEFIGGLQEMGMSMELS